MDELEKLYRAEERWVEVIGVKMQRAEALQEPEEKIRELLEVTSLWKKEVNDYDQATAAFEKILTIDPTHQDAFDALERLHTAAERWEPVVELYLNRLDTREDVGERSDLLRRIAKVFEEQLDDNNQAFDALVNAFSEDYSATTRASRYLERMAQATGRWGELINTANAWLQEQTDSRPKIQLCLRLGKWYGEDLGHPEYAQPYYAQIMQMDPNNVQVLRQMAAIHRMGAQWQKMGETLTRALDVAVANEDRKAILVDLGELLDKHMSQTDQGISFYKRALEVDSLFLPALEALERIYDERSNHSELVEILGSKVQALTDGEQIAPAQAAHGWPVRDGDRRLRACRQGVPRGSRHRRRQPVRAARPRADRRGPAGLAGSGGGSRAAAGCGRDRARARGRAAQAGAHPGGAVPQAGCGGAAARAGAGDRSHLGAGVRGAGALLPPPQAVARPHQHLRAAHQRSRRLCSEDRAVRPDRTGVYSDEVGDIDRAIDAYQNIVDLDEANIPALWKHSASSSKSRAMRRAPSMR